MVLLLRAVGDTDGAEDGAVFGHDQRAAAPRDEPGVDVHGVGDVDLGPAADRVFEPLAPLADVVELDGVPFELDGGHGLVVRGHDAGRLGAVHRRRADQVAVRVDDGDGNRLETVARGAVDQVALERQRVLQCESVHL